MKDLPPTPTRFLNLVSNMSTKTQPLEKIALFGGITAVVVEWTALFLFYINAPVNYYGLPPLNLSYFATLPETRYIFATSLSIAAISFWVFVKWHLSKKLETPIELFTLSMFAYLILACTPFDPTNAFSHNLHKVIAFVFTVTFIWGMFLLGKNNAHTALRTFSYLTASLATFLSITMFALTDQSLFFMLELLVGFICQIWIIGVTLYTFKIRSH